MIVTQTADDLMPPRRRVLDGALAFGPRCAGDTQASLFCTRRTRCSASKCARDYIGTVVTPTRFKYRESIPVVCCGRPLARSSRACGPAVLLRASRPGERSRSLCRVSLSSCGRVGTHGLLSRFSRHFRRIRNSRLQTPRNVRARAVEPGDSTD